MRWKLVTGGVYRWETQSIASWREGQSEPHPYTCWWATTSWPVSIGVVVSEPKDVLYLALKNDSWVRWEQRTWTGGKERAGVWWGKAMRGELMGLQWKGGVGVKGLGLRSPEKQVMLVLPLIEQLAVAWLYSVNAMNAFAAVGRYHLFKDVKPHFLQFCSPWVW